MDSRHQNSGKPKAARKMVKAAEAVPFAISFTIHGILFFVMGTMIVFEGQLPKPNFLDFDPGMFAAPVDEVIMEQAPELQAPDAGSAVGEQTEMAATTPQQGMPSLDLVTTSSTTAASSVFSVSSLPALSSGLPVNLGSKQSGKPRVGVPGGRISRVSFFGIKQETRRVAFLIDVSQSMVEAGRGGIQTYAKLKEEVANRIRGLDEGTYFNLFFFGSDYAVDVFQPEMVLATPDRKAEAVKFLEPYMANLENAKKGLLKRNYKPDMHGLPVYPGRPGSSRMDAAIAAAFELAADVIFVVSDGVPWVLKDIKGKELEDWEEYREKAVRIRDEWIREYNVWKAANPELAKDEASILREGFKVSKNYPKGDREPPAPTLRPLFNAVELSDYIKSLTKELYQPRGMGEPIVHAIAWGTGAGRQGGRGAGFLDLLTKEYEGEYKAVDPKKEFAEK